MMVKLLQDTYLNSPLHKANMARSDVLILEAAPRVGPPKVGLHLARKLVPSPASLFIIIIIIIILDLHAEFAAAK